MAAAANKSYILSQIRNEKSDQEVRSRMIEMVSKGLATLEEWGTRAANKQAEFNDFLERNHMCISMELVTAFLGDHGQRPREDYAVVTAVAELGNGKPKFYSTPEIIAFCRKWGLPTNHV